MTGLARRRILVVEDEVWLALDLESTLEDVGCEIIGPMSNVPEALHSIGKNRIDAAILDMNVGGVMSYEVADALAAAGIPFLIMTGHDRDHLPERLRGRSFLQKPYDSAALLKQLAQVVDGGDKGVAESSSLRRA